MLTAAEHGSAAGHPEIGTGQNQQSSAHLAHQQKFLESVRKKLSNERFVANAPEAVVAVERKKEADSLSKIESLTAAINALKNNN